MDLTLRRTPNGIILPPGVMEGIIRPTRHIRRKVDDKMGLLGKLTICLWDRGSGRLIRKAETPNLVIDSGKANFLQNGRNLSPSTNLWRYISLGSGTTAPVGTDSAIETPLTGGLKEITGWDDSGLSGSSPVTVASVLYEASEANGNIAEGGLVLTDGTTLSTRALLGQGVITNATQANPVRITSADHGLVDSERVLIENVGGMTELNGNYYYVDSVTDSVDADEFDLYLDEDLTSPVDGSGFTAYTSGGKWTKVVLKTTSFVATVSYSLTLN